MLSGAYLFESSDIGNSIATEVPMAPNHCWTYHDGTAFEERADSLGVDGQLSLSIMAGAVKLQGAGSYLTVRTKVSST